ncbi:hypothetical protein AN216_09515 [Streptomyces oceani]|uniref:ChbG/HpnK family deacetylase n=1 Tax=Streptomyces oceani TaxID=1075402 RepID=A0A1E7KJ38_9ACTN|nr:polysaccharide deacetylase family protein [Streptomyces oceani]OEV03969.1 hypothetical protein AN216_09515 [Streptomyces oceani]
MDTHLSHTTTSGATRLSSELLGFSLEARVLLVNCDDMGMHTAVNTAVVDSVERGIASSCSLMTPCPAADHAMRLLSRRPEVPFGVHLTLVRDSRRHSWGPLAPRERVPSLLDDTGWFFVATPEGRARLLAQARPEEIEREFRAQIEAVAAVGHAPTHLDFHCLADGGRDDILDLTVALAAEYGLAVRVWLEPGCGKARRQGLPVADNAFLDSFSLEAQDIEGKAARYAQLLSELPAGLSEWAVHPAIVDEEWRTIEPAGWRVRQSDHHFLTSDQAAEVLQREGIDVIDYRPLQRVWSPARDFASRPPSPNHRS